MNVDEITPKQESAVIAARVFADLFLRSGKDQAKVTEAAVDLYYALGMMAEVFDGAQWDKIRATAADHAFWED